eukprot:GHVO01021561.1.p1 GENE.GHVO01021561.1~~GHVO01021561.1.p1  ORF type:complete len:235 (+),score=33.57 GHVO01021561.1:92-706(+)
MTGHGGDEFLKFRDWEEISSRDIGNALQQMWEQKRYKRVLFVSETCQAATLQNEFYSPNIIAAGCSKKDQNSYSYNHDSNLGVALIDRFTYFSLKYLESLTTESTKSLYDFFSSFTFSQLQSDLEYRDDLFDASINEAQLIDFISSSSYIFCLNDSIRLEGTAQEETYRDGNPPWSIDGVHKQDGNIFIEYLRYGMLLLSGISL